MVKKWIFILSLCVILIVSCIFEARYINKSFDWLINSLETLQIEMTEQKDNINTDDLIRESYDIHNEWHEKTVLLKCLIWHTGLKDIEIGLARISVYISENDYKEAFAETASLIDYIAHYLDDFRISRENIL